MITCRSVDHLKQLSRSRDQRLQSTCAPSLRSNFWSKHSVQLVPILIPINTNEILDWLRLSTSSSIVDRIFRGVTGRQTLAAESDEVIGQTVDP
ncbi:hypothetical protein PGT21_029369 [Puccinia graminis f. sp. tritici]|uniref:Uncharacterized protein n=1 Tax=Puccinia graminis f. sp. tritici TaxID=56615 RepID=A0A5B0RC94_PUCGR|nr:hypothetical protein PGT21_031277 [Puccinia graminis f. sp. tritici]KAA1075724.1 hypothetical protein PGT21_000056 [Puccinia graminis f. sp. tritici]KAA1104660.1 hypothetical protein PGT21_029369 [Puccinia graminis f. sp. tritici]KAA1118303.1 hypothetical protein PGTUg99_001935 [Puccinia graminis f. sp. tritici]KAA1122655.1 hypothetical protein PGTUg99_000871 [Puccinia graminis f. sp. tritici]